MPLIPVELSPRPFPVFPSPVAKTLFRFPSWKTLANFPGERAPKFSRENLQTLVTCAMQLTVYVSEQQKKQSERKCGDGEEEEEGAEMDVMRESVVRTVSKEKRGSKTIYR